MVDRFGNPEDRPGLFDADRNELTGFHERVRGIDAEVADWIHDQDGDDENMEDAVMFTEQAHDLLVVASRLLSYAIGQVPQA